MSHIGEEEWQNVFANLGAYWHHDGNPKRPHVGLTSGGHSDGFFNGSIPLSNPKIARLMARDLALKLMNEVDLGGFFGWIFGPAVGAIALAHSLAEAFEQNFFDSTRLKGPGINLHSGYTEKGDTGQQIVKRFDVEGSRVIACEDTITKGGSVQSMIEALTAKGANVMPFVLCICNRSGQSHIGERKIISLISPKMSIWASEADCPLCQRGSRMLRPAKAHWTELNADLK